MRRFAQSAAALCAALALAGCPQPPNADFSAAPLSGTAPLDVQFTDLSDAGNRSIGEWLWNFGDGATSVDRNPVHRYAAAGAYTVTLRVASSAGSDTATKSAYVNVAAPTGPTANFTGAPRTGSAPRQVQFTDTATPGSQPIGAWSWNFGDGATSTQRNPVHEYEAAGSYTVALTVTTPAGSDSETKTGYIVLTEPPAPAIALSHAGANGGLFAPGAAYEITVSFTKTGDGEISALGLRETLPAGWTFDAVAGGTAPQFVGPAGSDPRAVEFGWFTIPDFPFSFTYRALVPADAPSPASHSGQAIFRTSGPELRSPVASATFTAAAP